jgi:hypothetical protein
MMHIVDATLEQLIISMLAQLQMIAQVRTAMSKILFSKMGWREELVTANTISTSRTTSKEVALLRTSRDYTAISRISTTRAVSHAALVMVAIT